MSARDSVKVIITGASLEGKESSSYLLTTDNGSDTYLVSANFTFEDGQILRIIPSHSGYTNITINDVACTIDNTIPLVANSQYDLCFDKTENKFYVVKATGLQPIADMNVDTISEKTSGSGVTIDGVLLKDSEVNVDHINEKTSGHGVSIDSVLLKDGIVDATEFRLNGATYIDKYYTTTSNSTEYLVTAPFSFTDGAVLRILTNTGGLSQINVNSTGVKKIYGMFPLTSGFVYELIYRSTGDGFYANKFWYPYVPTSDDDWTIQWSSAATQISSIVTANRTNAKWSVFDSNTTMSNPWNLAGACSSICMMADGRIFCTPWNGTVAKIFDPSTDTFSNVGTFSGTTPYYVTSVLLPSGKILMIPYNATANKDPFKIFDPADSSFTSLTVNAGQYNRNGILLPDGKVLITPSYSGSGSYVLDPIADSKTTCGGTSLPVSTYRGNPCLAPNGKAYIFRYNSTTFYEYDVSNNTWGTKTASVTPFSDGQTYLLSDGKIWPGNEGYSAPDIIYDASADAFTSLGDMINTSIFTSGCLLPDGRLFTVGTVASARVYDPISNTIATPANVPAADANGGSYDRMIGRQAVLLRDGRILVSSYNNINWYIYSNGSTAQTNFTNGILASRICNNR